MKSRFAICHQEGVLVINENSNLRGQQGAYGDIGRDGKPLGKKGE